MLIILRFWTSSTGAIVEHFVWFIAVAEKTGEYLTNKRIRRKWSRYPRQKGTGV